jgi:hypothetical protein
MPNQINPDLLNDKRLAKQVLESQNEIEKIKAERGWLGGLWGISSSIPNNLAALTIVVLLLMGMVYTFCMMNCGQDKIILSIKDFWAIISPLITLAVGYLFGDKSKKNAP